MYSGHQEKATGDQIKSSETTCAISITSKQWKVPYGVRQFFAKVLKGGTTLQGWCHCWRCQCGSIQILQEAGVPRSAQLLSDHSFSYVFSTHWFSCRRFQWRSLALSQPRQYQYYWRSIFWLCLAYSAGPHTIVGTRIHPEQLSWRLWSS